LKPKIILPDFPLIQNRDGEQVFFCPYCRREIPGHPEAWFHSTSEYLQSVFGDERAAEWIASNIMHFRHRHLRYYNNSVGYNAYFHDYQAFKDQVNNRIKRRFLREITFPCEFKSAFLRLQANDEATLKLIEKTFPEESLAGVVHSGDTAKEVKR